MRKKAILKRATISLGVAASWAQAACGGSPLADEQPLECVACGEEGPPRRSDLALEVVPVSDGTGELEYRLTNESSQSLAVVRWETALQGTSSKFFEVQRNGRGVPYVGTSATRLPPTLDDVTELEPGASLVARVDLPRLYAMTEPGEYTVRARPVAFWRAAEIDVAADADQTLTAETSAVLLSIDDEHTHAQGIDRVANVEKATTITSCSTTESSYIAPTVENLAVSSLRNAGIYLRDLESTAPPPIDVYERWFGALTVDRWLVATARVGGILLDLPDTDYTCRANGDVLGTDSAGNSVTCGDSANIVAVTRGDINSVDLCPLFFALSAADSASFLTHELSHQNRTAPEPSTGTDDIAGPNDTDILNLAILNPDAATRNSYSFQRFVAEF